VLGPGVGDRVAPYLSLVAVAWMAVFSLAVGSFYTMTLCESCLMLRESQVEVIADVCYDFLRILNLNSQHHDRVLSLSNAVLTEHIADNQVS